MTTGEVDLSRFANPEFERGASKATELAWLLVRKWFFENSVLPINKPRRALLARFGAKIGVGAVIKPRVRIHLPWRLTMGDHVWLGEESYILNLAPVTIGNNVCISQRAFLCTGSHDWSDPAFRLLTKPITIEDGAWVSADVFVGPGVTIGRNAVATAGSVVLHDLPPQMICSGNPCVPVKPRVIRESSPIAR
ncbi:MAG: putative colanic acid biosynthesis acetyltransferase [Planctomycetota bacterium]